MKKAKAVYCWGSYRAQRTQGRGVMLSCVYVFIKQFLLHKLSSLPWSACGTSTHQYVSFQPPFFREVKFIFFPGLFPRQSEVTTTQISNYILSISPVKQLFCCLWALSLYHSCWFSFVDCNFFLFQAQREWNTKSNYCVSCVFLYNKLPPNLAVVLVCWSHHNKLPQTGWLGSRIFSRSFWG